MVTILITAYDKDSWLAEGVAHEGGLRFRYKELASCFHVINIYIIIFVLSNIYIYQDIVALYWAKHAVAALAAVLYFFMMFLTRSSLLRGLVPFYTFWLLGFMLYLFFGLNAVGALQYLVFFAFVCCVSSSLNNYKAPGTYFIIFLSIPVVIDVLFNQANFLYNTYYGRPRLLLGVHHPKEIGNIVSSLFLLYIFFGKKRSYMTYAVLGMVVIVMLYFIQSRNSLLFLLLFFMLGAAIKYFGVAVALVFYFITLWFLPFFLGGFFYDQINTLSSFRLDNWNAALESYSGYLGALGRGSIELNSDIVRVDNYFVSLFIESGVLGICWIVSLFSICCYYLGRVRTNNWFVLPLVPALFTQASLDAGLFSTGNILNVVCWAIIFHGIQQGHRERIYRDNEAEIKNGFS